MTDQIILQMPCQSCETPCLWPTNPPKIITATISGISNLVCTNCTVFNDTFLLGFVEKTETFFAITCKFTFELVAETCTVLRVALFSTVNKVSFTNFLVLSLEDQFDLSVSRWTGLFSLPDSLGDGPFVLNQIVQTIQCSSAAIPAIIEAF